MADQLQMRRLIGAAIESTEGTYNILADAAASAFLALKYDPKLEYDVERFERTPSRGSLDAVSSVHGGRMARVTFDADFKTSGIIGTVPALDPYLRACGMAETGTAVNALRPLNPYPAVGNVFESTPPGPLVLTVAMLAGANVTDCIVVARITAVTPAVPGPGDVSFQLTAYPKGSSTTPEVETFTYPSAAAHTFSFGSVGTFTLDMSLGTDPFASTDNMNVGDEWWFEVMTPQFRYENEDKGGVSVDFDSTSLSFYRDGTRHRLAGCRGDFKLALARGKPGRFAFDFMGKVSSNPDDTALLAATFEPTIPIPFQGVLGATLGNNLSGGGRASIPCFVNFEFSKGNNVQMLECAGEATGYKAARIVGPNKPVGKIDPLADLIANRNPWVTLFNGTTGYGLNLTIGNIPGQIMDVQLQLSQIMKISDAERNGHSVDLQDLAFPSPEYSDGGGANYSPVAISFR